MDLTEIIQPGLVKEESFPVDEDKTARHVGSGSSRVLATPWLIAFMERLSHRLLAERLPAGFSSVGAHVDVRHLAPTPLGSNVRVRTEVTALEGWRVSFVVQAWDETELVGEGTHQRVVIDEARFLRRVEAKQQGTQ